MRKYLRAVARANMKRAGVTKMNKHRYTVHPVTGLVSRVPSYFAANWRNWVNA